MVARISAVVTAQSTQDGKVELFIAAIDGATGFRLKPVTLTLALWREDPQIVRVSLLNPATGTIAYLQGAGGALALARELGLALIP